MSQQPKSAPPPAEAARPAPPPRSPQSRLRREVKVAQAYDEEIGPLWTHRFARMLLAELPAPAKATILDVFCATGYSTLELLRRLPEGVRVVAIDPSPAMLDVARQKAGAAAGRRVFFRSEPAEPGLPFDSDVFDLVLSNLGLSEVAEPRRLLAEMVRVAKPSARVCCTLPLQGTFVELYDPLEALLGRRGDRQAEARLREHLSTLPSVIEAKSWLVEAGLSEPRVECATFTLVFGGARELFFSPLIEYGPLQAWKTVIGGGPELQEIFWQLKEDLDRAAAAVPPPLPPGAPHPVVLTVVAGCLSGRKQPPEATRPDPPPVHSGAAAPAADDPAEVELHTGEIDILGLLPKDPPKPHRG